MKTPILWYFADPMCSWCWGFSPVIDALRNHYHGRLQIALVLGGLRPGTTMPLSSAERDEILHHWRAVHARTGQPFRFDDALPPGFVYDSEPPSRAVLAVASVDAALTFACFKAIQSAFYADGRDVTRIGVLASLANDLGVDAATFAARFESEATRAKTLAHFAHARRAGVHGFPALILQQDAALTRVCEGCQPLDTVSAAIEACLA